MWRLFGARRRLVLLFPVFSSHSLLRPTTHLTIRVQDPHHRPPISQAPSDLPRGPARSATTAQPQSQSPPRRSLCGPLRNGGCTKGRKMWEKSLPRAGISGDCGCTEMVGCEGPGVGGADAILSPLGPTATKYCRLSHQTRLAEHENRAGCTGGMSNGRLDMDLLGCVHRRPGCDWSMRWKRCCEDLFKCRF